MKKLMIGTGIILLLSIVLTLVCIWQLEPALQSMENVSIAAEADIHTETLAGGIPILKQAEDSYENENAFDQEYRRNTIFRSLVIDKKDYVYEQPGGRELFAVKAGNAMLAVSEPFSMDNQSWIQVVLLNNEQSENDSVRPRKTAYIKTEILDDTMSEILLSDVILIGIVTDKPLFKEAVSTSEVITIVQQGVVVAAIGKETGADDSYYKVAYGNKIAYLSSSQDCKILQ